MTAAQIAEIVGTERKAWWPSSIHWDGNAGCFVQNLSSHPDLHPHFSTALDDDIAELAFIGAAVRELARRQLIVRVHDCSRRGGQCRVVCWHAITEEPVGTFDGETALAALVAALNESEGK